MIAFPPIVILGVLSVLPLVVLAAVLFTVWDEAWNNPARTTHWFMAMMAMSLVVMCLGITGGSFVVAMIEVSK